MHPTTTISVLIADDHQMFREGLRKLLSADPQFSVVGEAANGLEALRLMEELRPDVLVVDVSMPELSGLEVVRQTARRSPSTRAVVLSMHSGEPYVIEALRNGAAGYVLKEASASDLAEAVRQVAAGKRYLSPSVAERAIAAYIDSGGVAAGDPLSALTGREREVFHLVAEGHSTREIAQVLSLSPRTVEMHRQNVMRKLGLRNKEDLLRFAIRHELLPGE